MALGLPAIQRVTLYRVGAASRKFVAVARTLRNDSILLNTVHRLVIDIEHQQWWVEEQKEFRLLGAAEPEEPKDKKKKGKGEPPPSNFILSPKYTKNKKPEKLPDGVVFNGVLKEDGFVKEGGAYIHFFPNGYNEAAIIYLGQQGSANRGYSLIIRPGSGQVEVSKDVVNSFE
jgi:general secretion pathway protein H